MLAALQPARPEETAAPLCAAAKANRNGALNNAGREPGGGLAAGVAAADGLLVSRRVSTGISASSAPCPDKTLPSGSLKTSSRASCTPQRCAETCWVLREAGGMKGEEEELPSFQQPSCLPWACWKDLA